MLSRGDTYGQEGSYQISNDLNRTLNYLMWVTLLTFFAGALTFNQDYPFVDLAYSHIGRFRTFNGKPNVLSLALFSLSLILSAIICFRLDRILSGEKGHQLFLLAAIGYLLMLAPCDVWYVIHSAGAVFVIASFWLFIMIRSIHMLPYRGKWRFLVYQIVLQGTILPYAFLYISGADYCNAAQKLAILGIILSLKMAGWEIQKDKYYQVNSR